MPENQPTNPGLSDASNNNEEALPELQLKEIQRSAEAVNIENSQKCTIDCFVPWNDYTILSTKTSSEIRIYNEKLKKIEDFKINNKKVEIDWKSPQISEKIVKINRSYSTITAENSSYNYNDGVRASKLPVELRYLAEKTLKNQNQSSFTPKNMSDGISSEKFIVSEEPYMVSDYIIFFQKKIVFSLLKLRVMKV